MSTIDPSKHIQKVRTEDEIRKALQNCIHCKVTMCVPPQIDDDDIVLYDAFKELKEARKALNVFNTTPFGNLNEEQRQAIQDFHNFVSLISSREG